jgi:hypothetical protein
MQDAVAPSSLKSAWDNLPPMRPQSEAFGSNGSPSSPDIGSQSGNTPRFRISAWSATESGTAAAPRGSPAPYSAPKGRAAVASRCRAGTSATPCPLRLG